VASALGLSNVEPAPRVSARLQLWSARGAAIVAAVVLVTGAGVLMRGQLGGGAAAPTATAAALASTASLVPTNGPTLNPSPTLSGEQTAAPLQLGPLPAGRYTSTTFDPELSFTLGDGWTLTDELPQFIQFIDPTKPGLGFVITRFRAAIDPLAPGGRTKVPNVTEPQEFVTWLDSHPYIDPGASAPLSFGELRGPGLDFVAAVPEGVNQGCPEPCIALFWLTEEIGNTDRYGINDGWHYRMNAVSAPGDDLPVVVFITEAPTQEDFVVLAPKAFTVTSTVRFAGPS
jgi:hypothetical protein